MKHYKKDNFYLKEELHAYDQSLKILCLKNS